MRSSTVKFLSAAVLIAVIALFPADGLRALGLGEARVDSYLGQPLDVTIRLIEPDGGSLDSLTVSPAVAADYDRLGVPSTALALGLSVSVDRRMEPPQIRVTSNQEVVDPVVQVLVDARWSSGRVLREYTLFLDPPTLPVSPPIRRVADATDAADSTSTVEAAPEQVDPQQETTPVESESRPEPRPAAPRASDPEPVSTPPPSSSMEENEATPASVQDTQASSEPARETVATPQVVTRNNREVGPVEPGQTLWSIAAAWRPSTGLTMNQVMLAILDQNPQAFIDNNVNQLRRDAMLMMPSSDDIADIDASEAERRMRSQMRAWEPGVVGNDVPLISDDAVPEIASESDPRPDDTVAQIDDTDYRLEVVPPEGESVDDVPAVSEDEIDEATARLAELEDQIQAEGLDNDDLYRQVEDIRDAIEARDLAGLAVANEDLATLESRLRDAREARELEAQLAAEAQMLADETDDAVDEVDEFFNNLEDEIGLGEEQSDRVDSSVDSLSDEALDSDADIASDQDITADQMASDQIAEDEAMEPAATMPVTRTSSDQGWPAWLWTVLLGLAIVLVAAAVLVIRKLRGDDAQSSGPSEPAIEVDAARQRVAENPDDLDAHLGLLAALGGADGDNSDQFADALDDMYSVVDDDNDPRWQQALNLAVLNAPDHPLLTPNETGLAEDDTDEGLDEQTREMLGILDKPDNESEIDFDEPGRKVSDEDIELEDTVNVEEDKVDDFFAEVDSDDDASRSEVEGEDADPADDTIVMGDDELDLAELSDRLDDGVDDDEPEADRLDVEEDSSELTDLMEGDSDTVDLDDVDSVLTDDDPEHPALEASAGSDDLDLDFEFSSIDSLGGDDESVTVDDLDDDLASDVNSNNESDVESDDDSAKDSAGDSEEDHDDDDDDDDASSPTDTLDLSSQSGSNDTLRMDRDELAALNDGSKDDTDADDSDDAGTVRADDTLELVSGEIDFEDMGDRELEAFLAEGDDVVDSDEDEPSILDPGDDESGRVGSEEENGEPVDDESADEEDESEPELSDDDAEVKLDLAQAYISMDGRDSARTLLGEIISGGSRAKRKQAQKLLDKL